MIPAVQRSEKPKRIIFHLDMDAFYAAVEQRDNPRLKGKPVIVGSPPNKRGVVAASSYEARKFGVRSAMPSSTAGRLCPNGIFVPPRIDAYREESQEIMDIIQRTGAATEQMSIDEAYLEFTHLFQPVFAERSHDALLQMALPLAREIKSGILAERQLTASIGVASNKFLAKLGSDWQKPDGLTLIPERDKAAFLRPLPIRSIHGVGAVTEKNLTQAGIHTIGDLQNYQGDLRALVGSFSKQLRDYAFGNDDRPLELGDEIKSISSEETFERDTSDRQVLKRCLWEQSSELAAKLNRKRLGACTVQVKVRYSNFQTVSRQTSLEDPISDPRTIYRLSCFLLARHELVRGPLRLLGIGVSSLKESASTQLLLF